MWPLTWDHSWDHVNVRWGELLSLKWSHVNGKTILLDSEVSITPDRSEWQSPKTSIGVEFEPPTFVLVLERSTN